MILLHDEYGLTDREIAQSLSLSLAAAKMRIHRGRARLRAALEAGCQFETDDRGVLVCDPVPGRRDCGPGCTQRRHGPLRDATASRRRVAGKPL